MRTKLRSRLTLLFMSFALLLAIPAMALADTLYVSDNTLVTNQDTTKAPGGTGTANVWLEVTKDIPERDINGCNVTPSLPGTVTFSSNNPAVTFPNGNTVQITDCSNLDDKTGIRTNVKSIAYKVADNAQAGQAVISADISGGKDGSRYLESDTLTVTILAPAKQNTTVSLAPSSGTYGGSADLKATLKTAAGTALSGKSVTFTLNGTSVGSATTGTDGVATKSASLSGIDAGTYTNAISANFAGDTGNNGSTASGDLTVNKAQASLSLNGLSGHTYNGQAQGATVATDPAGLSGASITYNDSPTQPTNAGTYDVVASLDNPNYQAQNASGTMVIAKATPQITWSNPAAITHGTLLGATQLNADANVAGSFSYTPGTGTKLNAGPSQDIKADFTPSDAGNYNGASKTVQITVNKADQAIDFGALANKTFGDADFALSASSDSGLGVGFASKTPTKCSVSNGSVSILAAGTCTIEASQGGNSNYNAAPSVERSFEIAKKTATVTLSDLSHTYDGTAKAASASTTPSGLSVNLAYSQDGQAVAAPKNAGDYRVVATVNEDNYQGSKEDTLSIAKASSTTTVTCTGAPFTYNGSAITPCTVSVTGAGGLDLAPNANYSNNTNAGTATASYTYAGGANHTGSNDSKTFTIDKKSLTGSFTAANKVYDGNTNATISGYTLNGKIAGDDVGLDVHGGQFSDKNVANGKSVTVNAGDLTGADRGNYVLASGPWTTTANITPLSITGSFTAADKVYDGNANAAISGRALQGAINGDVVSLSGGSATFNDKNVANGKPVSGTGFTLAGTDKGNYTLGSVSNTTANITPLSITGSFTAADKVYDGNDSATVTGRFLSDDAITGDDVKLDGGTAKFSNKNVASAKPVTLTGASLVGADKGNYTLGSVSDAEADITARDLTVSATGIDKVYDGTASATVNLSTNELSGDAVRASYAGASFANKNVGTGKPVSVNGISISGADAANYSLTNATASTAADITARGLVVTATAANKVYDGNTDATVSLSDNRVSGDVLSTSYASASFDNANAGTGKVVTVSGISVAGADSGNYTFNTSTTTSADIAKRAITVTADAKSKLFGDADPALTYQVSGGPLVSGDGFSGNLSRDPGEAPGQYSILQGSVSAGPNYAVNYVGAKLTIGAWTTKGFYAPVDMLDSTGKYIVNTVKGGSTVPMKFELFKGATELKDVSAVKSTTYSSSSYCGGAVSDEIEVVMTGSTSLRYDATGDQFIYNWKTPTGAGCYKMTMTAQDGSQLIAYFKTR